MKPYTIGFTKTSAEHFFERLATAGVTVVVDTRVDRRGQLSGFAKDPDLAYFLKTIASIGYRYEPLLAPPAALLEEYRRKSRTWDDYARRYRETLEERGAETLVEGTVYDRACLLCSEHAAERCHRSIAAEYLRSRARVPLEVVHL